MFQQNVCVRRWDIHGAVVCIPAGRLHMHVRVDVQMSFVDAEVLLMYFLGRGGVSMSDANTTESEYHFLLSIFA